MHAAEAAQQAPRIVGRYAIYGEVAAGGMATVHFGRLVGQVGFSRTVAIKRLHPQFAKDPDFVTMFIDEARLAARIQHPNVVPTLDVVALEDELFLVMEYVQGEALSKLIRAARRRQETMPPPVALSIMAGALHGLHAAHEAKSERGTPLNIVHRDISPQNILVGTDGVARVLDFGVAKAAMRATSTRDGQMKGKVSYMAPEQMRGRGVDRRTDIFAAGIVLWEALTGRRLFDGNDPGEVLAKLLEDPIPLPSSVEPSLPQKLDAVVMKALERDVSLRYATARDFATALEEVSRPAFPREVGEWVETVGGDALSRRAEQVAEIESVSSHVGPQVHSPPDSLPAAEVTSQVTSPSEVRHSMVSQPSHASVPSAVAPAPKRGPLIAVLLGVAAALGIAFVVLLVALVGRQRSPSVEAVSTGAAPSPPPVQTMAPAVPPQPAVSEVASAPEPVAAPSASAPVAKPKLGTTAKVVPRATSKPATKPTTAPTPPKPASNCNPPYTVDKNGIKRPKPECL